MEMNFMDNWVESEHNPIKKIFKRLIRKITHPIVKTILENSKQIEEESAKRIAREIELIKSVDFVSNTIQENKKFLSDEILKTKSGFKLKMDDFEDMQKKMTHEYQMTVESKIGGLVKRNQKVEEDMQQKLGALARELTRTHWHLIDDEERLSLSESLKPECPICGYTGENYQLKETECVFGGGHLIRYTCPQCGSIFGPTKFSHQTQEEMDDDYIINYIGYKENDSTNYEIETFMMLKPNKEGIYLNYGCGVWAKTLQQLNERGFHVFGYEPYATDIDNPYIITDTETIKKMKFDGIFSHDLLEHLKDPVSELKFMKSLLKSTSSQMAHATACYRYKYEYSRFHTVFYTGEAVKYLCARTGLVVKDYKDDGEKMDFICYVFGITDKAISFIENMRSTQYNNILIVDRQGERIYGPYFNLSKGKYRLYTDISSNSDVQMTATSDMGRKKLQTIMLHSGENWFDLYFKEDHVDTEFVLTADEDQKITLNEIGLV